MTYKKIVFLTSTRAEFGKIKILIDGLKSTKTFKTFIFVTGLHTLKKFGSTYTEIINSKYKNYKIYKNIFKNNSMLDGDQIISDTIRGFKKYIQKIKPDLIVIHGDRYEALAGSIVGAMNNILTAHIEGGEVSGNIDEIMRHAITKLSHVHFPSNLEACKRLIQLGEKKNTIFNIGSPDIDIMLSRNLPTFEFVKKRYDIKFDKKNYGVLIWHPDSLDINNIKINTENLIKFVNKTSENYIVIYPNNDFGNEDIIFLLEKKLNKRNYKIFPSIRFENFLTILKNAKFIIGNSSCGIREAPYYGINTINIGQRQHLRSSDKDILNIKNNNYNLKKFKVFVKKKINKKKLFGSGNSKDRFLKALKNPSLWKINKQKYFNNA